MGESKTMLGFSNGHFFVGSDFGEDVLRECLVMVFSESDKVTTNLVNPVPFGFSKDNKGVLPSMKKSQFLYLIDLKNDVDGGEDLLNYYQDCVSYEINKFAQTENEVAEVVEGEVIDAD